MRRIAVLLVLLTLCGCTTYPRAVKYPVPHWFRPAFEGLVEGLPVPDFELTDLAGQPWQLSDHRGKVIVLVFASNTDPSYVSALDAFNREVVDPFAGDPRVLFVTIYSQESHPELADTKWNPNVILPGSADERRVAASRDEYRLRFRYNGRDREVSGRRPTAPNAVTLIDRTDVKGEPVVGRVYGYGRGGSTCTALLIDGRGRLVLKSIWLRDVLSIKDYVRGNLPAAIERLLKNEPPAPAQPL